MTLKKIAISHMLVLLWSGLVMHSALAQNAQTSKSVSYTHLTLPTKA